MERSLYNIKIEKKKFIFFFRDIKPYQNATEVSIVTYMCPKVRLLVLEQTDTYTYRQTQTDRHTDRQTDTQIHVQTKV